MMLLGFTVIAVAAVLLWLASLRPVPARWTCGAGLVVLLVSLWLRPNQSYALTDFAVLCGAVLAGGLLARTASSWPALAVLFLVAATADLLSFLFGPTRELLGSPGLAAALPYLSITVPSGGGLLAVIGVGDLLFLFAAFLAFRRLEAPRALNVLPVLALEAALAAGLAAGGVPALPFLAVSVVASWWLTMQGSGRSRLSRLRRTATS